MKKFFLYLLLYLMLNSCKDNIASEEELIDKIKGFWVSNEITNYYNGVSQKVNSEDVYWEFNDYNDLVIYQGPYISSVAHLKYSFSVQYEKNKLTKRDIKAIDLKTKSGAFNINGKICNSQPWINKRIKIIDGITYFQDVKNKWFIMNIPESFVLDSNPPSLTIVEHTDEKLKIKFECNERGFDNSDNSIVTMSFKKINRRKWEEIKRKFNLNKKVNPESSQTDVINKNMKADHEVEENKKHIPSYDEVMGNQSSEELNADNLYRNEQYKFRIRYPEGWESIKGDSKQTIAKFARQDSGKTISITVVEDASTLSKGTEITPIEWKSIMEQDLKRRNINFKNLRAERGFLNNYPAIISEYEQRINSLEFSIDYIQKQISVVHNGYRYTLFIAMPKDMYDMKERNRLNKVVNSFVFE